MTSFTGLHCVGSTELGFDFVHQRQIQLSQPCAAPIANVPGFWFDIMARLQPLGNTTVEYTVGIGQYDARGQKPFLVVAASEAFQALRDTLDFGAARQQLYGKFCVAAAEPAVTYIDAAGQTTVAVRDTVSLQNPLQTRVQLKSNQSVQILDVSEDGLDIYGRHPRRVEKAFRPRVARPPGHTAKVIPITRNLQ